VFLPAPSLDGITVVEAAVEEVPLEAELNTIQEMVFYKNSLYIVDTGNHRILRIENNKITRQIGIIGNSKGELYYPSDLYIGKNGYFYVLDRGNRRIQILNSQGGYIGHFKEQPRAFGLAVNSKGNLLLGQAKSNHLISVYDLKGNRILDFGELIKPSGVYGGKYKKYDKSHRFPMNRLYLAVGENDELWAGFYHMPVICKFNRNGCLVSKKIIELPGLEPLKRAVWDSSSSDRYITFGLDGLVLTKFVNDLVYEENSRRLYVLLGDNRILVLNSDAVGEYVIKPRIIKGAVENIAVNNKGEIFASFFFSTKLYRLVPQNFFCPQTVDKISP
jgi:DNA-binding beta-propeller fold protein YncE